MNLHDTRATEWTSADAGDLESRRNPREMREMEPWEDPICCCEAEPRWLKFEQRWEDPSRVGEWEVLERPPSEEF